MTPGPVSDSYDPEFGTAANAAAVRDAIDICILAITREAQIGERLPILDVVHGKAGRMSSVTLYERDWRVIRFALHRAMESL